jgi:hypothetical protein
MNSPVSDSGWDESPSAPGLVLKDSGAVFESFFERSVDAVWLLDQQAGVFVIATRPRSNSLAQRTSNSCCARARKIFRRRFNRMARLPPEVSKDY